MPRTSAQNDEIKQESRRRLIEAATCVFRDAGYAGARMADIASKAGMSHGLVFHYFANKEAMFIAVVEATMGRASDMAKASLAGSEPAISKLRRLCSEMLEAARQNGSYTVIMFQTSSTAGTPEAARQFMRITSDDITAVLARLISEAQQAGDLADDNPHMLARTLLSTLSGLALSIAAEPQSGVVPNVEVVMRLLGPI